MESLVLKVTSEQHPGKQIHCVLITILPGSSETEYTGKKLGEPGLLPTERQSGAEEA
jgi:hypothetical protein